MKLLIDLSDKMLADLGAAQDDFRLVESRGLSRVGTIRLLLAEALGAREIRPELVPQLKVLGNAYAMTALVRRSRRRREET